MNECECGEDINPKRYALGYRTCLDCGERDASKRSAQKARQVAPAFNKGAYQYITSVKIAKTIGR